MLRLRALRPCLLAGVQLLPAALVAQEPDAPVALAAGVMAIPAYQIYNGRVNLSKGAQNFGGQYAERAAEAVGVQASFTWGAAAGALGVAAFAARASSEGRYSGLAAPESHVRDLLTLGMDLGWRPVLVRSGWGRVVVPFGPTVVWQRLALSRGHRDAYASPTVPENPEVDWSDRRWLSVGGHAGVIASIPLGGGFSMQAGGSARFLYYGNGAWAGQEERDIRRSAGEVIHVGYEDPIILLGHGVLGVEWRPEG